MKATKAAIPDTVKVGIPFAVKIARYNTEFRAVCLTDKNRTSFEKNVIEVLSPGSTFAVGDTFTVEDKWFDFELTGRRIIYDSGFQQ